MNRTIAGASAIPAEPSELQLIGDIFARRLAADFRSVDADLLEVPERALLITRFVRLVRQLSALMQGERGAESRSLHSVLMGLMRIIGDTLGAERSTLFLHDPASDELYSSVAGGGLEVLRFSAGRGIAGKVFRAGEALMIADVTQDQRFDPDIDAHANYCTRSVLCVPLLNWDGRVIGVTEVLNKRGGAFNEEDQALLEVLTSHAAAALQSMQLNENVQQALRDEAQLLGITTALSSELKLDTLLRKIIRIATAMLSADRGTLLLYDKDTDQLRSMIAEGLDDREIRIGADQGIAGWVFQQGKVVNLDHAYADPRFNRDVDRITGYSTESVLCVPVTTGDARIIGTIQVLNKADVGAFTERDEERLVALAAQAAIAIRNARLFEAVLNARNYSESILRSLSNGVITLDPGLHVIRANPAASRILGLEPHELPNRALVRRIVKDNRWLLKTLKQVKRRRRQKAVREADIVLPEGAHLSVNLNVDPLVDVKGRSIGYLLIVEDISREKRVKSTMSRYMSHQLAERLWASNESILGGQSQEVTVLFSDIKGFTGIAERLGPQGTVTMLNDYFSEMAELVFQHNGILDKYIGDGLMALFGTPFPCADDADNALSTAIDMTRALCHFNERRARQGKQRIDIRIGMSTGEVIAGNIGSPRRMDYTVVGHTVNQAAQAESAGRLYGSQILVTESTRARLRGDYRFRELDLIRVKGSPLPVRLFEVLDAAALQGGIDIAALKETFERGVFLYRRRDWSGALSAFRAALRLRPDDAACRLYIQRCGDYAMTPPAADWDGVWIGGPK